MGLLLSGAHELKSLNIIAYSSEADAWKPKMAAAEPAHMENALEWVMALRPKRETNMNADFTTAIEVGAADSSTPQFKTDRVYFLTDGEPSDGDPTSIAQQAHHELRVPINTIAFAAPERAYQCLQGIASNSGGMFRSLSSEQLKTVLAMATGESP